jgi:hypothetical protein
MKVGRIFRGSDFNGVALQLCSMWDLQKRPKDLPKMELMVMSALGWKIQTVTAATVLDTLACLLDFQDSMQNDSCQQMHIVRETCKLILARALRGK